MILDTTYLLPLARIEIDTDLLKAIAEKKSKIESLDNLVINSISIFELQAKAAKLKVKSEFVFQSIFAITKSFKVEQYYSPKIVESSFELRRMLTDYIDCIILATGIVLKEDVVTEDSRILKKRREIKDKFGIDVFHQADLLITSSRR